MRSFNEIPVPAAGEAIGFRPGGFVVPDRPIIPFIEGDGTGRDIWRASRRVFDAAVRHAYGTRRQVAWYEVLAGDKAHQRLGTWLPDDTIAAVRQFRIAIKGPLTTPVGGGIRSLNVTLRQVLDLYACVRPIKHYPGVPSPVTHPDRMDLVIFRENTEDVYAGIEFREGSEEARKLIAFLENEMGKKVKPDSGIGLKPMSVTGSKRLVRMGIEFAIAQKRSRVTLVHKGNIQKFTEGAFRDWGYQVAREEFADRCLTEEALAAPPYNGQLPPGMILINDRIADSMFQQVLTRADEYQVVCTPNLNGDYLSDACAAQVGGLGMAPGANMSREYAFFEATHGTAPKYADQDMVNPGSVLLSGVMMFHTLGWHEAADAIEGALARTIAQKRVTYDLERLMPGATRMKTSEFASALIENLGAAVPAGA